jgi:avirulence D protein (AvrD)
MPMITNDNGTLVAKSVDDHLGPGATRFFGSGYRRVDYTVTAAELSADGRSVRAAVEVHHPVDWSKKGEDKELRPHLSTLDVLILAVRAAETLTSLTHRLDGEARTRTWIRRVDIKAPNKPIEDGFASLPFSARHVSTEPSDGRLVSTLDCRVSTMRVRVELVHDTTGSHTPHEDLDFALGHGYPGLYGAGFQRWRQFVDEVLTDVREDAPARADAMVLVEPPTDGVPGTGPESARGPVVSMIDSFVVALQLGQILLYETDGMSRADSDTLWMRHTTLTAEPPSGRQAGMWFPATTELHDSSLLHARSGTWRTATIVGDCFGVVTRCAVAHLLPSQNP